MKTLLALTALCLASPLSRAINIVIDTTHAAGFFGGDPAALAAIQAAADDISNVILPTLGAVPTDEFSGVNADSTATFNWDLTYSNPTTGAGEILSTFNFAADGLTIYVGSRVLANSTLGVGGPGGVALDASIGGFASEFPLAVANAAAASNAAMPRGGGPVISSLSGSLEGNAYTLTTGAMVGVVSFDSDTNNDNTPDDDTTLANFWHYDHTTPVAAGKNDLYSVALHEILHAIGFGTATTWNLLKSGTNWNGTHVVGLLGSGANLLSADVSHISEGFTSPRLSDGVAQEAVMDPSITVGTRKSLTELDVAFLRDLGYLAVPEPTTSALLLGAAGMLAGRRGGRRKIFRHL